MKYYVYCILVREFLIRKLSSNKWEQLYCRKWIHLDEKWVRDHKDKLVEIDEEDALLRQI